MRIRTSTLLGLNQYIKKNLKTWKDKKLVVGITGFSGSGKSSLINALRGIKPNKNGAARVGVKETTATIKTYTYPNNDRVLLKDFPGVGTNNFPEEDYMKKTKLLDSDVVVIVHATRFTNIDTWVAKKVLQAKKNVLIVRTKIDNDLDNAKADYPDDFSEYTCMATIREEIEKTLAKEGIQNLHGEIYLVSSRYDIKYDFRVFVDKLGYLLSVEGKAICSLLCKHMEKTIKTKTEKKGYSFTGRKVASFFTGLLPIPKLESTLDQHHVSKIWETCLKAYCIDTDSLKQIATEINESVKDLESRLKSYGKDISDEERLYVETEDRNWSFLEKYSKYTVPILGMLYSAYKSPVTLQECLTTICRVMAGDEMMLVKLRLRELEKDLSVV